MKISGPSYLPLKSPVRLRSSEVWKFLSCCAGLFGVNSVCAHRPGVLKEKIWEPYSQNPLQASCGFDSSNHRYSQKVRKTEEETELSFSGEPWVCVGLGRWQTERFSGSFGHPPYLIGALGRWKFWWYFCYNPGPSKFAESQQQPSCILFSQPLW